VARRPRGLEEATNVSFERVDRREVVRWWAERFGVPEEVFEPYEFYAKGRKAIWAIRRSEHLPKLVGPLRLEALGMVIMRMGKFGWKPTTNAIQVFGRHARKNVVDLDERQMRAFVAGEPIKGPFEGLEEGFVVVRYKGRPLGCGLYRRGVLHSQVPKIRRRVELI